MNDNSKRTEIKNFIRVGFWLIFLSWVMLGMRWVMDGEIVNPSNIFLSYVLILTILSYVTASLIDTPGNRQPKSLSASLSWRGLLLAGSVLVFFFVFSYSVFMGPVGLVLALVAGSVVWIVGSFLASHVT